MFVFVAPDMIAIDVWDITGDTPPAFVLIVMLYIDNTLIIII